MHHLVDICETFFIEVVSILDEIVHSAQTAGEFVHVGLRLGFEGIHHSREFLLVVFFMLFYEFDQ